jgi:hypothetical protein
MNTRSDAEQFITRFADFWRHPSQQRLPDLLHPDVVLVQPLAPRTVGLEAAQAQFHRFCCSLPGLTADVDYWSGDNDIVFIEFRLTPASDGTYSNGLTSTGSGCVTAKGSSAPPTSTL